MKYIYRLQIDFGDSKASDITKILGVEPTSVRHTVWELELTENEADQPINFVGRFMAILGGKFDALAVLGVRKNDVTVWLLYEYKGECNLEFSAQDMKVLGNSGVALCVSCWPETESLIDDPVSTGGDGDGRMGSGGGGSEKRRQCSGGQGETC